MNTGLRMIITIFYDTQLYVSIIRPDDFLYYEVTMMIFKNKFGLLQI